MEARDRKKNQESSSDSSSQNEKKKNQNAILKEMHDAKIKQYIEDFEEKNLFRRETTQLYRNKHMVQQMQRTEKYFLQDLKEKVKAKHDAVGHVQCKTVNKQGPNSRQSSVHQTPMNSKHQLAALNLKDILNSTLK